MVWAEMFSPNHRSKPIFRKNAEHYVAYNALYVMYHDTISCMYQHIQFQAKMCLQSVNKLQLSDHKKGSILILIG